MKTEKEIRQMLSKCEKINETSDVISDKPCPFTNEIEVCAECTNPEALKWVLEEE